MRKIFTMALALIASISMYAGVVSDVTLTLANDYDDMHEAYVYLKVGDTYDPFSATNCSSYMPGMNLGNSGNVDMYATYGAANYTGLNAGSLVNIPLVVITNCEAADKQDYTIYVDLGTNHTQAVTLTDLRSSEGIKTVTLTGTTQFTFDLGEEANFVAGTHSVIADRFVINYDPTVPVATVTTNEEGWATFAFNQNVVAENTIDLTVYAGAINGEELTLSAVDYVKAGEGVVVKGAATTTYNFLLGSGSSDFSANDLIGCPAAATVLAGTNFVLSYQNNVTAFYQYTGTTIPAGTAYLNFPASSPAPERIRMVINGATDVESVAAEAVKSEKVIRDGQIVIIRNGVEYNAAGQIIK